MTDNRHSCRVCMTPLVVRSGKHGKFLACPNSTKANNHGTYAMPDAHEGKQALVIDKETGEVLYEYTIPRKSYSPFSSESPLRKTKKFSSSMWSQDRDRSAIQYGNISSRLRDRSFRLQDPGFREPLPAAGSREDHKQLTQMLEDEQEMQQGYITPEYFDEIWGVDNPEF